MVLLDIFSGIVPKLCCRWLVQHLTHLFCKYPPVTIIVFGGATRIPDITPDILSDGPTQLG